MHAYPKSVRLRRTAEFRRALDQGAKVVCPKVVLFGFRRDLSAVALAKAEGELPQGVRFGIVASKKVGNAVVRNRVKRRLREAFRHVKPELEGILSSASVDLVVLARNTSTETSAPDMARDLVHCAKRLAKALETR